MCGRYQLGMEWDELLAHYRVTQELFERRSTLPWYNQAPGQPSPVVFGEGAFQDEAEAAQGRVLRTCRWGFPPLWVARRGKDPWKERPLVNAKSEEARNKATWKKPLAERRCLVPTTGFYEWIRRDKDRFPLHFRPPGGGILTLAGIWSAYSKGDSGRVCFSILTTGPNDTMRPVHDRMPVILAPEDWDTWLDPDADDADIDALCAPAPAGTLEAVEVSTALNGWQAYGEEVLEADWSWSERPA